MCWKWTAHWLGASEWAHGHLLAGNLSYARTRLLSLRDDPKLFLKAPTPPPFNSGNDLHTAGCL
jgi:hypothetical protein